MPIPRRPAWSHTVRFLGLAGLTASALGCAPERPAVVRVADAIPRSLTDPTLLDVVRPALATLTAPRVEVVRWTLHDAALTIAEAEQARRFTDDASIVAVVGHAGSKSTLLAAPIYREAGMPLIIPTATARELRDEPNLFMLAPSDDAVGAFLADAALDSLRGQRIAMMHVADAYGEGIRQGVDERLAARGAALAGSAVMTGRECADDRLATHVIALSLLQRARPDVVILALSQAVTVCLIETLVEAAPGIRILTADSYTPTDHTTITPAQRRAVHSVLFWVPGADSMSTRFVAEFRALTGRAPDAGQALSYDAFLLLREAVREGHTTRAGISAWLRALGTPAHPPVLGVTGPIHFQAPRSAVLHLHHLRDPAPAP